VEIVRRAFADFQADMASGNPAAAFDEGTVSPDLKWILPGDAPGMRSVYQGRDEWLEFMKTWTEDFDWSIEIERIEDLGEGRVFVKTHQRAAGKASGVPVELLMGAIWTVVDGQVVEQQNFFDPAEALAAAGLADPD
jgi:ketosteroid isomerase-like protein